MANEPIRQKDKRLDGLRKRLDLGAKWRQSKGQSDNWDKWRAWTRGEFSSRYIATDNIFYKTLSTMRPQLYFKTPAVTISSQVPGEEVKAIIGERLATILIDELDYWKHIRMMVTDVFHCGATFATAGMGSSYALTPGLLDKEDYDVEGWPKDSEGNSVEDAYGEESWPWWCFTSADQIIVPWGTNDDENCAWFAKLIIMPRVQALKDWRFNQKVVKMLQPSGVPAEKGARITPSRWKELLENKETEDCYLMFFELHDRERQEVFITDNSCEHFVMSPISDELQVLDMLPLDRLCFNWDSESIWGAGDSAILARPQTEINYYRDSFCRQVIGSVAKKGFPKGRLDPDERSKLNGTSPSPAYIELGANGPIKIDDIIDLSFAFPTEMMAAMQYLGKDAGELMHISANTSGEFEKGRKAAAEVIAVREGGSISTEERRDVIAKMIARSIDRNLEYIRKFWTIPKALNIAGPGSEPFWISVSGYDVPLKRKIKIEAESTQPIDREVRKMEAMKIFEALRGDPMIDQGKLYEMVGRQFTWLDIQSLMAQAPLQAQGMGGPGAPAPAQQYGEAMQGASQQMMQNPQMRQMMPQGMGGQ
jgi:hypothetical protein